MVQEFDSVKWVHVCLLIQSSWNQNVCTVCC